MKTCCRCRVSKEPTEFYRRSRARDGLEPFCKACSLIATKKSRKANPERVKRNKDAYVARHADRIRKAQSAYAKKRYAQKRLSFALSGQLQRYHANHEHRPCVYLIGPVGGPAKIGKTCNLPNRLKSLCCGSPIRLEVLGRIDCASSEHAISVERDLQRTYRDQRSHGEWFELTPALLAEFASDKDNPPTPL